MARAEDPSGRDRILAAAAGLFYVRGVRAVGLAELLAAAGCGKNMLYRHFSGKAALVAAYLELARAERDKSTADALAGATRPAGSANADEAAGQLVALVAEVAAWVRRRGYRGCAFRNYLTEFPSGDDEPALVARAYLRDTRGQVDGLVRELGAPAVTADRVWLLIDALYANTGGDPAVAVEWARELVTSARSAAWG
ncbi:TetR/AcrR family transcriptional regulator [Actinoplanes sp. CA-030573]|uniref:TetR/AcrR family transcriptional regulator n=1 Tax=Actinoplanes sp. CA-030573 TaxID=3239898 RepID=UPI003D8B21DD